jgi:Ca2+-binding EF-hand superfamily protein
MKSTKLRFKSDKNLKNVRSSNKLTLSLEQRKDLKIIFDAYDRDGRNNIIYKELGTMLKTVGFDLLEEDYRKINIKSEEDRFDFEEFVKIIENKLSDKSDLDSLRSIFQSISEVIDNSDKFITLNSLREILLKIGEEINDEELKEMMIEANPELKNYNP